LRQGWWDAHTLWYLFECIQRNLHLGGSSSGSAVAVAKGLVSFSLGTDTAGSGRVPAAFNQLVGVKPTRGLVSAHGLLPACRTLDCVSIFAETCADAAQVLSIAQGFDAKDAYSRVAAPGEGAAPWTSSRFRFGVPTESSLEFFGDESARAVYLRAADELTQLGGEAVRFDYAPFHAAASLLYSGPWVAERLAAVDELLRIMPPQWIQLWQGLFPGQIGSVRWMFFMPSTN